MGCTCLKSTCPTHSEKHLLPRRPIRSPASELMLNQNLTQNPNLFNFSRRISLMNNEQRLPVTISPWGLTNLKHAFSITSNILWQEQHLTGNFCRKVSQVLDRKGKASSKEHRVALKTIPLKPASHCEGLFCYPSSNNLLFTDVLGLRALTTALTPFREPLEYSQ